MPPSTSEPRPAVVNLFHAAVASPDGNEAITDLLTAPSVRIERIVSNGHRSPDGFWYDQAEHEWVALFTGAARLRFEDEPTDRELSPGDTLFIAAGRRHRVEWTTPDEVTIWLAVFYSA